MGEVDVGRGVVRGVRHREGHGQQAATEHAAVLVRSLCVRVLVLQVRGQLPLEFVAPVLEPNLDLGLGELQRAREARALGAAQVTLQVKRGLELKDLPL